MSILINMEMPKDGFVEILIHDDGTVQQTGQSYRIDGTDYYTPYVGEMPVMYKAIPVPPHGRLIDADELMLRIQEYIDEYGWDVDEHGFHSEKWCAMKETEMAINDAPTVIGADKDGET